MLKDIEPGPNGSLPQGTEIVAGDTVFYFTVGQQSRVWRSDGTPAGTVEIQPAGNGPAASSGLALGTLGDTLIFTGINSGIGFELYRASKQEGTSLLADIYVGVEHSLPGHKIRLGNALYFTAKTAAAGTELWKTDGTANGTVMVKDICPGSCSSSARELTRVGDTLYFVATDGQSGEELWKTDGTGPGTVRVKDLVPGALGSMVRGLVAGKTKLFFVGAGDALYESDGTETGTVKIDKTDNTDPDRLATVDDTVFYRVRLAREGGLEYRLCCY